MTPSPRAKGLGEQPGSRAQPKQYRVYDSVCVASQLEWRLHTSLQVLRGTSTQHVQAARCVPAARTSKRKMNAPVDLSRRPMLTGIASITLTCVRVADDAGRIRFHMRALLSAGVTYHILSRGGKRKPHKQLTSVQCGNCC